MDEDFLRTGEEPVFLSQDELRSMSDVFSANIFTTCVQPFNLTDQLQSCQKLEVIFSSLNRAIMFYLTP